MTPTGYRRLILTRHAKSDWDDPSLEDHDRPLNGRGRRSAHELGDWLASRGYEPEEVLCSSSLRTRETWDEIARMGLAVRPAIEYLPSLFHATPDTLLAELRKAKGQTVMMIGHNPGIGAFASIIPARPPMDPEYHRFPTCATAVIDFSAESWADVGPGEGSVLDFVRPDGR